MLRESEVEGAMASHTSRSRMLAAVLAGGLVVVLGAWLLGAFLSPQARTSAEAVYPLGQLQPGAPFYDARVPLWIVALPEGGYRAFSDESPLQDCGLEWLAADSLPVLEPEDAAFGLFREACGPQVYYRPDGQPLHQLGSRRFTTPLPALGEYSVRVAGDLLVVDLHDRHAGRVVAPPPEPTPGPIAPPARDDGLSKLPTATPFPPR
jgi:hypothetical protein